MNILRNSCGARFQAARSAVSIAYAMLLDFTAQPAPATMNVMIHLRRLTRIPLTFAALSLFFLGTSLIWLRLDHSPPSWDDGAYPANSLLPDYPPSERGGPGHTRQVLNRLV